MTMGILISIATYRYTLSAEQDKYLAEVKVEANSHAMSLDLIMANYAIKLQNFEDNIDVRHMNSRTNKEVVRAAFNHSIFSAFSFIKYRGISPENGEVMGERILRITSSDKEIPPVYNDGDARLQSPVSKQVIYEMIKNHEKQRQFFIKVKGEALYIIVSRSVENQSIFYTFVGFAKNLFKENFPVKINLEGFIHQDTDDSNWHILKIGKKIIFEQVTDEQLVALQKDKIPLHYEPRFNSEKYFNLSMMVPKISRKSSLVSIFVLLVGFIITILMTFLVYYLINSNIRIKKIVKERTRELEEESKKAKEATVAKSRFLANISHEIRTPLNIVLGMTDLLDETSLTAKQKHFLDSINNSGRHLLNLINDILDMTRVDVSDVSFKSEKVQLLDLIEDSCLAVDEIAKNKNLDLYLDLDPSLPQVVDVDPSRIRQILINLLTNAVKYTEKGFIELKVNGKHDEDTADYFLEFRVKDSGVGISEIDRDEIFKAFYQVNSTVKRSQGGVGLGLSIVSTIVKRMGGVVDVQSTLGVGSTFIVKIPLKDYSEEAWTSKFIGTPEPTGDHVLISNDTILIQIFHKYMKAFGKTVRVYSDLNKIIASNMAMGCIFVDLDSLPGFQRKLLSGIKFFKLVCIGEPSSNPGAFLAKGTNTFLWPNKLLLPKRFLELFTNQQPVAEVVKESKKSVAHLSLMPEENAPTVEISTGQAPHILPEDANILVVDDDASNKILFEAYCATQKWNVSFASNGLEALENHLRIKKFDVLVTDLQMPIMDGFTLIQKIKENDQDVFKPKYMIVLSADSTEETIATSKSLSIDEFLSKPIRKVDFLKAIERGLH